MSSVSFRLRAWESWMPDRNPEKPESLPPSLRRRVTPIGRRALNVAWELPEAANARLILSSRHGEFSRTLSLLEAVTNGEDASPADFTLSVHHALIGLLSIVQGNRRGHTAIAAGQESFCCGLLEAGACLKEKPDEPVVLIHFDEPLPGSFAEFNNPDEKPMALALSLAATGEGDLLQLDMDPAPAGKTLSASPAQDFIEFLSKDAIEGVSIGEKHQWRWSRRVLD